MTGWRVVPAVVAGVAVAVALGGCTGPTGAPEAPPVPAAPPAPPAACLLDTGRLADVTGLTWIPDQSTASDTRCVYDPNGPAPVAAPAPGTPADTVPAAAPAGSAAPSTVATSEFLAVEITPTTADDAQTELDSVAATCADGSRAPIQPDATGFVCRFRGGGSVFAAAVRAGQLVTVSASAVPVGTTAARLVVALQQQLDTLGR